MGNWVVFGTDLRTTVCDDFKMVGGYGIFGRGNQAEFNMGNLPFHHYLKILLSFSFLTYEETKE